MESDRHRLRGSDESSDRLSKLPTEVADEVLKRLPIRDAIKTSLLSASWRYRWMSMSCLVFDKRSLYNTKFVDKVLLLHNGIVSKFELTLDTDCADIDHWILVLSRKKVTDLILSFTSRNSYIPPTCLYSCETLRHLKLEDCTLKLPSGYLGFAHLTHLVLFYVNVSDETLERVLAKTPLLQKLNIFYCRSLTSLNIDAPNLVNLSVYGCFKSINFQNMTKVTTAVFGLCHRGFSVGYDLENLLQDLVSLQWLCIRFPYKEVCPTDIVPQRSKVTYHHLQRVEAHVDFADQKQTLAILCLCRSSPQLRTLLLTIKEVDQVQFVLSPDKRLLQAQLEAEEGNLHHLETVHMRGFQGMIQEIEFVNFILINAAALKRFWIDWSTWVPSERKLRILEIMMMFERASSKAKVIFNNTTKYK